MITRAALLNLSTDLAAAIKDGNTDRVIALSAEIAGGAAAYAALPKVPYKSLVPGQSFVWDDLGKAWTFQRVRGGFQHPNGNVLRADADMHDDLCIVVGGA